MLDWPETLMKIADYDPEALVPGRGDALDDPEVVNEAIELTEQFLRDTYDTVERMALRGADLKEAFDATAELMRPRYGDWAIFEHCLPFNVARAFDEARGIDHPRIWTAERDREMWAALQG